MKLICMGDSITYGYGLEDLTQRWTDIAAKRTGHTLVNCGVSGDTTAGMLARCQTQVFNQKADGLIFLGGINDLSIHREYRLVYANVISVFRQAQAAGVPLILGVPLPIDDKVIEAPDWEPDRDIGEIARLCQQYADWVCQYAAANQIPVVDFRTPFLRSDGQVNGALFQDGLHPTEAGHRLMAEAVCQLLEAM